MKMQELNKFQLNEECIEILRQKMAVRLIAENFNELSSVALNIADTEDNFRAHCKAMNDILNQLLIAEIDGLLYSTKP